LLEPIVLEKINTADSRENWGEKIGGMLPYLLFILCLQGAMAPATDIGAGEKERGTLETLLISPIERNKIVLGKFLTIGFAGTMTALITVASMALWGIVLSQGMALKFVADFMGQIGIIDFVLIFLMLVPVVSIFAAVLLSISIYAKSFKEAQSYMVPLVFLVIVPVVMALMPGVELKGGWAWVPLTNVALAMKELVKGTMDYFQLIAIFGSTMVIAGAALAFCVYWFKQEKVLFR
jgi:sodium transport system permease protein